MRRKLFSLGSPFRWSHTAIFNPKLEINVASPQTVYSITDDQKLFSILESCKHSPNFRTAVTVHSKIIKHGYEMYPLLLSMLIKVYVACEKSSLARQLLTEICSFNSDVVSANLLIDSLMKIGEIDIAKKVFSALPARDVVTWNSMIGVMSKRILFGGNGYVQRDQCMVLPDAILIFSALERENISPDPLTFIGIITACSHCGFVEQGRKYFNLMRKKYSIQPQLEHYGAMVDLFARGGSLEEAYAMIKEMPIEPDVVIWRTLLSACRTHKNSKLGEIIVEKIKHLGSGDYVLLSNIYCSTKKWDNAETVRHTMNKKGIQKSIGKSWVELHGTIHRFKAGDRSHTETEAIYTVLEALIRRSRMEGYVSVRDLVLMDISEEEKEENLNYHSEKLALAFAILKSSPGTEILISKNLRTCLDCHGWIKIVSRVLHRVITVRDRIRFHRFGKGSCSCGDYW
ncbi:hypothetical protein DH2020_018796 [Rehmannia glutinosa]|uniref:DYW domain-containing protein n=1 Tax=Rehmannia glutinosa TaxID=99300 RepID=A0ABR0WNH8_REHGL